MRADEDPKPRSDYKSRRNALDEAIRSSSRKRFQPMTDIENKNPNQYSVARENNPLTSNSQVFPQKPVKTAGCYIPKKKKFSKPTCVLNEDEMTNSDIRIRDLKECLLDMQVKRDMLRDRLNKMDLKTNQTAKSRMKKRDMEGVLDNL
jgi:hypothetical protein